MATITANGSKGHHKFTLEVIESSYSVDANTSDVTFTFKLDKIKSGYNWSGWGSYISYTVTIDGTNYTGTIPSYNGSSLVTLKSGSKTGITHNNDGTKTINYSFSVTDTSGQSYTCGNASASGTLTLTTIPRASQIGVADANIGSSTNITINKNSSSFTTTLYYKASGQSSWTKIVDKTANQVYAWTVPTSFYALIPNSKTISCQFYADTYNGSTLVGTSSTVTATFTATGNPTISSYTLVDTNSTTTALTGDSSKMVRYASNVRATVSASGQHSASVSSIKVNGTTASSGVVTFNGASTNSFQAVVTDSRGYTTSQTKTMTMVNYVALTLNATIVRNQPTDGNVKISYNGNYFNGSFGSQSNTLSVQYRSREKNGTWGNWTSLSPTISGTTYSQSNYIISGYNYQKQYEFQMRAIDKVQTKTITSINVSKGEPVYWWNDDSFNVNGNATTSKSFVIPRLSNQGIKDTAGNVILSSYSNDNVVVNAGGGNLFLGYQNTGNVNFVNGKYIISSDRIIYTDKPTNAYTTGRFILVPFTSFRQFETSGTQAYLEELIKWIVTTYPNLSNGVFIGGGEPGARGSYMLHIYDTNDTDSSGFPKYSSGIWMSLDKNETIRFGTGTYTYSQQRLARAEQIPSVTTGTATATKSSGNGTMTAVNYSKYGNMVTLTFTFNNSGSATASGGNIWVGTISGVSLPKTYGSGCGYFSSSGYMAELDSSGNLTIRVIGGQSAGSNTSARRVTMTYVCA